MTVSRKRREEIAQIPDSRIDFSDIPELDTEFWDKAEVVFPEPKKAVTIRLDGDVLAWFKGAGKGYQSRMNAVLRSYMENVERRRTDPSEAS